MAKNAQTWLENLSKLKASKEIWGTVDGSHRLILSDNTQKLTGNLTIENLNELEELNLNGVEGLDKLVIKNCPKLVNVSLFNSGVKELVLGPELDGLLRLNFSSDNPSRTLDKLDVSQVPNLKVIKAHGYQKTEIIGFEKLDQLQMFDSGAVLDDKNVIVVPNQKFRGWKDELDDIKQVVKGALGKKPTDSLPDNWKDLLGELKDRPTRDELEQEVKAEADKYKDFIDPKDEDKLKKAAEDAGFGFKQDDIDKAVQDEKKKKEGWIDPNDKEALKKAAESNGMVSKEENDDIKNKLKGWNDAFENQKPSEVKDQITNLEKRPDITNEQWDNANNKVKDYENGLKDKLGLKDDNLNTWKDEIDKLKNRPASDNSDQIRGILGLKPDEPLPNDLKDKLVLKTDLDEVKGKLDKWEGVFDGKGKNPEDVKKEIESKPSDTSSGATLTPEQQKKLHDYDGLRKWADEEEGLIAWLKNELASTVGIGDELQAQILEVEKKKI